MKKFLLLVISLLTISAVPAFADSAIVSWTAPTANTDGSALTDLASFTVRVGQQGQAKTPAPTGTDPLATTLTVNGLSVGTWCFDVVATNTSGVSSAPSAEACKSIAPKTPASPTSVVVK